MKNKKILGIVIVIILVIITILFMQIDEKNASYKVIVSIIEKNSPDRKITVLRNGKTIDFDSLYYIDDVLLCKGQNPTINKYDVKNGEELKIKLKNKKIVKSIVEKEE